MSSTSTPSAGRTGLAAGRATRPAGTPPDRRGPGWSAGLHGSSVPTMPSGVRPCAVWKACTAASVASSNRDGEWLGPGIVAGGQEPALQLLDVGAPHLRASGCVRRGPPAQRSPARRPAAATAALVAGADQLRPPAARPSAGRRGPRRRWRCRRCRPACPPGSRARLRKPCNSRTASRCCPGAGPGPAASSASSGAGRCRVQVMPVCARARAGYGSTLIPPGACSSKWR